MRDRPNNDGLRRQSAGQDHAASGSSHCGSRMKIGMPLGIPSVSPATDSQNPCLSGRSGSNRGTLDRSEKMKPCSLWAWRFLSD